MKNNIQCYINMLKIHSSKVHIASTKIHITPAIIIITCVITIVILIPTSAILIIPLSSTFISIIPLVIKDLMAWLANILECHNYKIILFVTFMVAWDFDYIPVVREDIPGESDDYHSQNQAHLQTRLELYLEAQSPRCS